MSNLALAAVNNPVAFLQAYLRTAMTVGGAVALNKFVEPMVARMLPDAVAPWAKEIAETVKLTNVLLIAATA